MMDFDEAYQEYLFEQSLDNAKPKENGCYSPYDDCPYRDKFLCLSFRTNRRALSISPVNEHTANDRHDNTVLNANIKEKRAFEDLSQDKKIQGR